MRSWLRNWIGKRTVLIAGYGREGRSSLRILSESIATEQISVADNHPEALIEPETMGYRCFTGDVSNWMLAQHDIIIKSPGLPQTLFDGYQGLLTTQVDIFFMHYALQSIGITGTKGKSTTASLLHHIFKSAGRHSLLAGNIGVPIFDIIDDILPGSVVVCELSAHQLENAMHVPSLSVLLNFFPEHLDHFASYDAYKRAKARIATLQKQGDVLIVPFGDAEIEAEILNSERNLFRVDLNGSAGSSLRIENQRYVFSFEGKAVDLLPENFGLRLLGRHNRRNALMAALAARISGVEPEQIALGLDDFMPLPHRLEPVGEFGGVIYYNDSIATVPQATIAAMDALDRIETLILGGYDRGIDYTVLYDALQQHQVSNVILIGQAGKRMCKEMPESLRSALRVECFENMEQAVRVASAITSRGGICLLSPAAASYDQYNGFEERGEHFKRIVRLIGS